jgi:hypothetical protein
MLKINCEVTIEVYLTDFLFTDETLYYIPENFGHKLIIVRGDQILNKILQYVHKNTLILNA